MVSMGSTSRLLITVSVIAAVITASVLAVTLPRLLIGNKAVSTVNGAVVGDFAVNNESLLVNINIPIYVIGPSSLVHRLVGLGIAESLIRPVNISQLPKLPNNGVIIIDWSVIKPSVIASDSGNKVTVNLTGLVIRSLAGAIARGDVIGVYANGSGEGTIDFILAYSWALASSNRLLLNPREPSNHYLLAYPIIPVNTHEAAVFIVKWVKPSGLIIGPVYLNQLPRVILNMMQGTVTTTANSSTDPDDPCYETYTDYNFNSNSVPGIYVSSNATFIWAAPMLYSEGSYYSGIPSYSDGNGTYYWDTCLVVSNIVYGTEAPSLPMGVIGYEKYFESSTMYNNDGYEASQLGTIDYYYGYQLYSDGVTNALVGDPSGGEFSTSSWNPPPASSATSYEIFLGLEFAVENIAPFIGVEITLPPGTSESISGSQNPSAVTSLPSVPTIEVSNITWIFNIGQSADNEGFPNSFQDITPAGVFLPNFPSSSPDVAVFNVDLGNTAVTAVESQYPCLYDVYQYLWVKATWSINVIPQSSSTVSLTASTISVNTPLNTYITGITSYTIPVTCTSPS